MLITKQNKIIRNYTVLISKIYFENVVVAAKHLHILYDHQNSLNPVCEDTYIIQDKNSNLIYAFRTWRRNIKDTATAIGISYNSSQLSGIQLGKIYT